MALKPALAHTHTHHTRTHTHTHTHNWVHTKVTRRRRTDLETSKWTSVSSIASQTHSTCMTEIMQSYEYNPAIQSTPRALCGHHCPNLGTCKMRNAARIGHQSCIKHSTNTQCTSEQPTVFRNTPHHMRVDFNHIVSICARRKTETLFIWLSRLAADLRRDARLLRVV